MSGVAGFLTLVGVVLTSPFAFGLPGRAQAPGPVVPQVTDAPPLFGDGTVDPALILGQVVRIGTGESLPGAEITLRRDGGSGQTLAAVADADGRFVLANIVAGNYRLEVEHAGYVDQEYGQVSPNRPGTVLVLAPGQQVENIVVNMVPTGVITGQVFESSGRPLEGVEVRAMRYEYDDGARVLETVRTAETNDLGAYRLYWLEPGEYFVSATFNTNRGQLLRLADALAGAIPQGRGGRGAQALELLLPQLEAVQQQQAAPEIFVDTYFPGTFDAARASSITVTPASEMSAINFAVSPTRAVTVSGRVFGPFSESDGLTTSVTLVPRSSLLATTGGGRRRGRDAGAGGRARDGSFSLSGIAPGSYTLVATMQAGRGRGRGGGNNGTQLSGFAAVEVGSQDLENVVVQVQPAATIRGQIWVDEVAAGIDLDDMRVRLEPPRGIPVGSPNSRIEDDGSFVLENVSQTVYRPSLTGLPEDYYLVQARVGASDVLTNGVQVTSSLPALEFWVSGSGATLDGVVEPGTDSAFTGAQVVLVPQNPERVDLYKVASADQYGRFSMRGIAPGQYSVFAWEDAPSGAYLDPIFVNRYRDRGYAVAIQQGEQVQAAPRLIPAEN